jgi:CO/xanthine dehydrogenase FAD-binding subunit
MRSAPFVVIDPLTVEEAIAALDHFGSRAKPLAGGQDLIGELNARRTTAEVLINLKTIRGLHGVRQGEGWVEIGSTTRMHDIEDLVRNGRPDNLGMIGALGSVASATGPKAVRTLGTLGGNIASTRAGTLWPATLSSLGARLRLVDKAGQRDVSVAEGIRALHAAEPRCLVSAITVTDDRLRLVVGRASLPLTPYPLPAVCVVAISRDAQIARITIVGPSSVLCVREVATHQLRDTAVSGALIADVLGATENTGVGRTAEIVLQTLARRVVSRVMGDDVASVGRTVIVDV